MQDIDYCHRTLHCTAWISFLIKIRDNPINNVLQQIWRTYFSMLLQVDRQNIRPYNNVGVI